MPEAAQPETSLPDPRPQISVGEAVAALLESHGVQAAFGVISIHNLPMLDAIARRGRLRFVMARGEAGAANMADAYARTAGALGVCITSTGTGAGNAAGALVEALTAGTPLLHLTGQIELPYLDRQMAYIHEAPDQLAMLKAVSKAAFRVRSAGTAVGTVKQAIQCALTAPSGPVSVEIPIDIQATLIPLPADLAPLPVAVAVPSPAALDALADALARARRPLLWLGGGARQAGPAVQRLLALGFGLVTSTQGRGVVPESHPRSLGAFNSPPPVEAFYQSCDAMLVVGSRLRGNETLKYQLKLPQPLLRVDADPGADGRGYANAQFVCGDAALALAGLADRLEARVAQQGALPIEATFGDDLARTRDAAQALMTDGLGPYAGLLQALQARVGERWQWVRDVTLSNSLWGNRAPRLAGPRLGVHALGGGIGQGLAMAIGAAVQAACRSPGVKTWCLAGDGGFILNLGELASAVQERCDLTVLLMNDQAYGVIKNIQDAQYGGRKVFADLHTPDYAQLSAAIGIAHRRVQNQAALDAALDQAASAPASAGQRIIEVDMLAFGAFKTAFAGPPVKPGHALPAPPAA